MMRPKMSRMKPIDMTSTNRTGWGNFDRNFEILSTDCDSYSLLTLVTRRLMWLSFLFEFAQQTVQSELNWLRGRLWYSSWT